MSDDVARSRIVIGRPDTDSVTIDVAGRMHAGAVDFGDGNWLISPIEVRVGGFRATIQAGLRAEELSRFHIDLEALHATLRGSAVLESMESWIRLDVGVTTRGHLKIDGVCNDDLGAGNELAFTISGLDQTDLPALIRDVGNACAAFPVLGLAG